MPLNEHEQRILEEIERQFYEDDPKLAETVANTTLGDLARRKRKWAAVGFVAGLLLMFVFFTRYTWVAFLGFIVMVASVGWIAMTVTRSGSEKLASAGLNSRLERLRQRWTRGG